MKRLRAGRESWADFKADYFKELDAHPLGWEPIARQARLGPVTLLYAMRNRRHNNAIALAEYLSDHVSDG